MRRLLTRAAMALVLVWSVAPGQDPVEISAHRDGVLGTSLDISIYGTGEESAQRAIEAAIAEIARLEAVLSPYRDDSGLSRLNAARVRSDADADLVRVVSLCENWREQSLNKFSCRLGEAANIWKQAELDGVVPDRVQVRRIARNAATADVRVNIDEHLVELGSSIELDPSGLAKGYIIDQALLAMRDVATDATGIKIDIGGDAVYWGAPGTQSGWRVGAQDPFSTADNSEPIAVLELESVAIAASGHRGRDRNIGRRSFSHLLSPRDGWPVTDAPGAIVIAPDAATADAVATALSVQTPVDGIDWVNSLDGIEALLVMPEGFRFRSAGWRGLERSTEARPDNLSFRLEYQIPRLDDTPYHRPYLAIWISDQSGNPVRNLLLLGESVNWVRENNRWWRRVGRDNEQLIDGLARPTRRPGSYRLEWDGVDDFGKPVAPGTYELNIEASRERGGHTYKSVEFDYGPRSRLSIPAEGEIGTIRLTIQDTVN